jgi:signal transduction histidine kinase
MLAMQTEANQLLEKKVIVRTRELESKNEEIQRQLFILDTQAHEIGETNAALQEKNMLLEEANNELKEVYHSLQIAQAQVIQTEKMASLGQLTAGIAHEINNPINYIVGGVTLLKENIGVIEQMLELYNRAANEHHLHQYFSEVEALKREQRLDVLIPHTFKTVEVIAEGAKRTEEIVRGLRTFARPYDNALKKSNINENLDLTVEFLQHQCRGRITIVKQYGALPEIECVPGELNQVFMNILVNAIQAIPPKQQGEIIIRTEQKGEEVYICIQDNGQGISPANRQKIFEPFFTTKDIGKGTGLGLYISFTIIEKHQGDISVESTEGQGTEFCIRLPLHQS